jgi:hypothetical protein
LKASSTSKAAVAPIAACRACGGRELVTILDLGEQVPTGMFVKEAVKVAAGPLELVKCHGAGSCGLVQLKHSYDVGELYGKNYGYRSGLNQSMVRHLREITTRAVARAKPKRGDLIVDIGSNDSTLLQGYGTGFDLAGIDPTSEKFKSYYPAHIKRIPEFFSAAAIQKAFPKRKAKLVTSIAMFYDLEAPLEFMKQVKSVLADDGVWVFEQSHMPTMLEMNAYDTVCHEHLEYYGLTQIQWLAERAGLKLLDVELNDTNGGSFRVTAGQPGGPHKADEHGLKKLLLAEAGLGLSTLGPYERFKERVFKHRDDLLAAFRGFKKDKKKVFGYGASTKGNVLLQFCGLTAKDIPMIAEVNEDKFGCVTPGSRIPIVAEAEARAKKPDYFMVLPWHFKDGIVKREQEYLKSGGKLLLPLPKIEVIGA